MTSAQTALRTAVAGCLAMAAALGIGRFVLTPILPQMMEALGLSASQAGLLASSNFLGYLVGAIVAASSAFSHDRRRWLLIGLAASVVSTAGMALSGTLLILMALRFTGGVASAFVLVFASTMVLEVLARHRRAALAPIHFGGVGLGIAVSAVLVAAVATTGGGWKAQWLWSGAVALAGFLAVSLLATDTDSNAPSQGATGDGGTGSSSGLGALIVAYGLFGFGYVITATFISTMVRLGNTGGAWLETAAWVLVGLSAIPSVAFWSFIAARTGAMRAYAVACIAQGVGVAASVLFGGVSGVLIAAFLLGGTFMGLTALGIAGAREASPGNPTRAIALMTASFGLGQMIGPTVGGVLADLTGGFLAPSLAATAALMAAAALAIAFGPGQTLPKAFRKSG